MDFCLYLKPQNPLSEEPSHSISRTWAKRAISLRVMRQIGQNAVQLTVDRSWKEVKEMIRADVPERVIRWTVPVMPAGKLPPREIPGCWFQLPQSDTWKLQHRMVSFPKLQEVHQ
jgi:hypothetical protein